MAIKIQDLIGKRFGMLVVIRQAFKRVKNKPSVRCKCDCGKFKNVVAAELKRGGHKSCGCNKYSWKIKLSGHPLYQIWRGMKGRCYYKNNDSYKWYGGAGVRVCALWNKSYVAFRDWCLANGWERGMQIDKDIIPKKLGVYAKLYSPEMCSIVTANDNKRESKHVKLSMEKAIEIRRSSKTDMELSEMYGVKNTVINKVRNNKMWVQ